MPRKKLSATEKAYNKELRRIKAFIIREEKKGFQFFDNAIPSTPKKITKASVRRLAKITNESLYKKAIYAGEATAGEVVSGIKGAKAEAEAKKERTRQKRQERRQQKQPDYYPDTTFSVPDTVNEDTAFFDIATIGEFKRLIAQFPKKAYPILSTWVDNLIEEHGQHNVAKMLNDGLASGLVINHKIAYDETAIYEFMADMLDYLDVDTSMQGELMDALESDESYNPFI